MTGSVVRLEAKTQELKKYGRWVFFGRSSIDTSKPYLLTGEFRTSGRDSRISLGMELFDGAGAQISPFLFTAFPGTETTLVKPLAAGDRSIAVKDASRWELGIGKFAAPAFEPAEMYGRSSRGLAMEVTRIRRKGDHYILQLKHPAKIALPAGAALRQHSGAPPFNAAWRAPIDRNWRRYSKLILPGERYDGNSGAFYPGTVAGRHFIEAPAGVRVFYRNVKFTPVEGEVVEILKRRQDEAGQQLYPNGRITPFIAGDGSILWKAKANSSLRSTDLRIPTGDVAQIEALVRADTPGMLGCFIYGFDGKKKFNLPLAVPVVPDGKPRWMMVHPDHPRGDGIINAVDFGWRNSSSCTLSVEKVRLLKHRNYIPGAEFLPRNTPVELDHMLGGSKYRLQWRGKSPGATVVWIDFEGREQGRIVLPAGENEMIFTVPASVVRGILTVNSGGDGFPVIREAADSWKKWCGDWIWIHHGSGPVNTNVWFFKEIELPDAPIADAAIMTSADDRSHIFVNGRYAGSGGTHVEPLRRNAAHLLVPGKNRIVIKVENGGSFGALIGDIFVKSGDKELFYGTDGSWRCHVGGDEMPAAFEREVAVVGNAAADRYRRLERRFLGSRPTAEVVGYGKNTFTLRAEKLPDDKGYFQYALRNSSGERLIALATRKVSSNGDLHRFEYRTPFLCKGGEYTLFLDDDHLLVTNDLPVGKIAIPPPAPARLKAAKYLFRNGRTQLQFGDRISNPFFWKFPGSISRSHLSKANYVIAAKSAGYDNVAISTDFTAFWTAVDKFDFSSIDVQIEQILSVNPDAVFMIQLGCFMPDWWLAANPDDVAVRENGTPRHLRYERQALSSQKWLKDAEIPIRALIEHLEKSPYGDRIWAFNVAENSNLEWFWWTGSRYWKEKPFISGFSKADLATFRAHLRQKYRSDEKLAEAWGISGVTFDTAVMPRAKAVDSSSAGALLDARRDRQLIDWFEYRNAALGNAFITLCKIVKKYSGGKLLAGGYYGYYLGLAGSSGHQLQDTGHNAFLEAARSPYVDFVRAPAPYNLRRFGSPEGTSIIPETFSSRGKVVYIECDHRSALKGDLVGFTDVPASRPDTMLKNVDQMNRIFGVMATLGISYYWYDITSGAYLAPVLNMVLARHQQLYAGLPPVQGLTPAEIVAVGDRDSIYYSKRNNNRDTLTAPATACMRSSLPRVGAAFTYCTTEDLLEQGRVAPGKLYIMFNCFVLSKEQRQALVRRFEAEKASVLWLYNAGASYPDAGPDAAFCADFTGIKMRMDMTPRRPVVTFVPEIYAGKISSSRKSMPWFVPQSGFDEVLGRDENGDPALVSVRKNGVTHYFSMLPDLAADILRKIAQRSGVHLYTADTTDNVWAGHDLFFIHTVSAGEKQIILPPGLKLEKLVGPLQKSTIASGEKWPAEAVRTYGFRVVKEQ